MRLLEETTRRIYDFSPLHKFRATDNGDRTASHSADSLCNAYCEVEAETNKSNGQYASETNLVMGNSTTEVKLTLP